METGKLSTRLEMLVKMVHDSVKRDGDNCYFVSSCPLDHNGKSIRCEQCPFDTEIINDKELKKVITKLKLKGE